MRVASANGAYSFANHDSIATKSVLRMAMDSMQVVMLQKTGRASDSLPHRRDTIHRSREIKNDRCRSSAWSHCELRSKHASAVRQHHEPII
jgi:hypothetical protein